jgi:hypothetical protein
VILIAEDPETAAMVKQCLTFGKDSDVERVFKHECLEVTKLK